MKGKICKKNPLKPSRKQQKTVILFPLISKPKGILPSPWLRTVECRSSFSSAILNLSLPVSQSRSSHLTFWHLVQVWIRLSIMSHLQQAWVRITVCQKQAMSEVDPKHSYWRLCSSTKKSTQGNIAFHCPLYLEKWCPNLKYKFSSDFIQMNIKIAPTLPTKGLKMTKD